MTEREAKLAELRNQIEAARVRFHHAKSQAIDAELELDRLQRDARRMADAETTDSSK